MIRDSPGGQGAGWAGTPPPPAQLPLLPNRSVGLWVSRVPLALTRALAD